MKRLLVSAFVATLLSSCASAPPTVAAIASSDPFPTQWSFLSTSNRFGELEPCGCSMAPMGGLQREKNVIAKWARETPANKFFFSNGTTFVPQVKHFNAAQLENYRLKAEYLGRALDVIGVGVVSPSLNDFSLGESALRNIQKIAKFKWVSSNLFDKSSGKPLFAERLDYRFADGTLYVLGISKQATPGFPVDARYEARDAAETLRAQLNSLPAGKKFIVLLSDQDRPERDKMMKEFPQINLVLGGAANESTWSAHSNVPGTIFGTASDLGRSILQVNVQLGPEPYSFVSSIGDRGNVGRISQLNADIAKLNKSLNGRKLSSQAKKTTEEKKQKLESEIKAIEEDRGRFSHFEGKMQVLGPEFDEPKDELTTLIGEYKEKVRGLALKESEN